MEIRLRNTPSIWGPDAKTLVWSASGRVRSSNEDVIYKLVLEECRRGALAERSKLAPGLYPPSAGVARLVAKVDAACLYNKKAQYKRF